MKEYRQLNMFDEYADDELEENLVEESDGYTLYQHDGNEPDIYEYQVFDEFGISIAKWKAKVDCLSMGTNEYNNCGTRHTFLSVIKKEKDKQKKAAAAANAKSKSAFAAIDKNRNSKNVYDYAADDDHVSWFGSSNYSYRPKSKSTGFLDKLNKSDTFVIHCADRSTDMLSQIYKGKGWDVLRDGDIDKRELHQLLQSHDRIVCLGHGTGSGLINVQGGGTVIGAEEAPYLKNKKLFIIWCNADRYFESHNIGKGQFITGNMPSEVWECRAAGCGEISKELMLENITYWSKLCADVTERALNGDVQGAVDYVRDKYIEKYGDHPVTIYNAERTKVHGKPMEDLSDRYWGPKELLHPSKPSYSFPNTSVISTNSKDVDTKYDDSDEEYLYDADDLQAYADDISGLYQLNPEVEDFGGDAEAMEVYIQDTEELIEEKHELSDVEYWTDIEDPSGVSIKVVCTDLQEYCYKIRNGTLQPL